MLVACVCNPIFINTFVVFVRLYWFEKRFQSVVLEAQRLRRTRERSRSKTEAVADEERRIGLAEEKGVGSKKITVVHPTEATIHEAENEQSSPSEQNGESSSDSGSSSTKAEQGVVGNGLTPKVPENNRGDLSPSTNLPRAVTFADQVPSPSITKQTSNQPRLPTPRSKEEHIAFVEKQNRELEQADDTLYIPGPRDFDRGAVPKHVHDASENGHIQRAPTIEAFPGLPDEQPRRGSTGQDDPSMLDAQRTRTATSDSAIAHSQTRNRLLTRVREHLPFAHHAPSTATSEIDGSRFPRHRSDSPEGLRKRGRTRTFTSFMTTSRTEPRDPIPYLSYQPTIGRNSAFVNLTEEQREELGGIEYRALKLLAMVLCSYFVGFHVLGLLSYLPWIIRASSTYKSVLDSDGVSLGWWGVFTPASMFNDLGYTLTPDSMISFAGAVWPLLIGSFLIIIGNTGFPCMLRFIIWVLSLFIRRSTALWEELRFLLDHPRRCFTLLFPSKANWWLFWVLVLLNGIDLIFFVILDLHGTPVSNISGGLKVLGGWFQAASTRTAGFAIINLSELHPAIQVSYLVMMYISVLPIAISVRRTNVYEEKSLGVYSETEVPDEEQTSYVGAHLRRQLSFDLWYVFLGLFIIAIVEGERIQNTNDYAFTVFSILFEVVSAYGTVGLSLGYPNTNPSFSGQFHVISKLVIIAMQLRGRHRGLPYALDKAILLPSEHLLGKEVEEANRRRGSTSAGMASGVGPGLTKGPSGLSKRPTQKSEKDEPVGLDAIDEQRGGLERSATTRSRRYSLGRLLSNALGAGPTARKSD